jgi:hypothetical protein
LLTVHLLSGDFIFYVLLDHKIIFPAVVLPDCFLLALVVHYREIIN